jgi:hypothetical protein
MSESTSTTLSNGIATEFAPALTRAPHWIWSVVAFLPALTGTPALGLGVLGLANRGPRVLREHRVLSGLLAFGGAALLAKWQLERLLLEEPEYELEQEVNGLEIRRYAPRVVAETIVADTTNFDVARREGFRRLAGYIFGDNARKESIAMTAPVGVRAEAKRGERIAMTAPVTARDSESGYAVTFAMPREWSLSDLPVPRDPRVRVRTARGERVAVLRFRGAYDSDLIQAKQSELLVRAGAAGFTVYGEPSFAGYDAPSTLPFLRRLEVWIPVAAE